MIYIYIYIIYQDDQDERKKKDKRGGEVLCAGMRARKEGKKKIYI
jgi:hypothetical protein